MLQTLHAAKKFAPVSSHLHATIVAQGGPHGCAWEFVALMGGLVGLQEPDQVGGGQCVLRWYSPSTFQAVTSRVPITSVVLALATPAA